MPVHRGDVTYVGQDVLRDAHRRRRSLEAAGSDGDGRSGTEGDGQGDPQRRRTARAMSPHREEANAPTDGNAV